MDDNGKSALVTPAGEPVRDEQAERMKVGVQLATQRQKVEEAKFAILVELVQAVEELSDTVWAVAGQLLPAGKGRKARLEYETLAHLRAQRHEQQDAWTIDKIQGGER